jgi:hypothetical protein
MERCCRALSCVFTQIATSIWLFLKFYAEKLCGWILFFVTLCLIAYLSWMYAGRPYVHRFTAPESKLECPEGLFLRGGVCMSQNAVIEPPRLREDGR